MVCIKHLKWVFNFCIHFRNAQVHKSSISKLGAQSDFNFDLQEAAQQKLRFPILKMSSIYEILLWDCLWHFQYNRKMNLWHDPSSSVVVSQSLHFGISSSLSLYHHNHHHYHLHDSLNNGVVSELRHLEKLCHTQGIIPVRVKLAETLLKSRHLLEFFRGTSKVFLRIGGLDNNLLRGKSIDSFNREWVFGAHPEISKTNQILCSF